jgi:PAS domain S-box-containing protein
MKAKSRILPSGKELHFGQEEIIVSKTDPRGVITYANDVFCRISGYSESEILGQPHNFIRHPDMPACVFNLLWDTVRSGQEIFAYVVNLAKCGGHYWVFAHVTPSFDPSGNIVGYHSNRRVPYPDALPKVRTLYQRLRAEEHRHSDRRHAIEASTEILADTLNISGLSYAQFVFNLSRSTTLGAVA